MLYLHIIFYKFADKMVNVGNDMKEVVLLFNSQCNFEINIESLS